MAGQNFAAFVAKSGSNPSYLSVGKASELLQAALHGKYYEGTYAGNTYVGGNTAGVTTTVGLATTYVGCCLSNPAGSGKNLAVSRISGGLIVAPTTITSIFYAIGYSAAGVVTHTTPLTPVAAKLNGTAGVGLLDSACTLVGAGATAPALAGLLAQCPVATSSPSFNADIDDAIIIPPGGWIATATNIAGPASGFMGFFQWTEWAP